LLTNVTVALPPVRRRVWESPSGHLLGSFLPCSAIDPAILLKMRPGTHVRWAVL
jgi:hypothetical protein